MPELTITGCQAFGLPDADKRPGSGTSDPYVLFRLTLPSGKCVSKARTAVAVNDRNPEWPKPLLLSCPTDFTEGMLNVMVLDDDICDADDMIGSIQVPVT